jgi:hypothetical protein
VTERSWQGSGFEYTLVWGGRPWTLRLDADCPGLYQAKEPANLVLALHGLASVGRVDPVALSGRSLVGVELVGPRVEARFAPSGWSGLQVVARWGLASRHDGIDLEVEALASSVGELKAIEVVASTRLEGTGPPDREPHVLWVHPRDSRSAALSYDGREPASNLARLTTLPVPVTMDPEFSRDATIGPLVEAGERYLEFAHPHDVARRVVERHAQKDSNTAAELSIRYGLFGHDLEKGVIVRARLRGLWISRHDAGEMALEAFCEFAKAPPPLA